MLQCREHVRAHLSWGFVPLRPSPIMWEEEYVRRAASFGWLIHLRVMSRGIVVSNWEHHGGGEERGEKR